jgi:hypothetical protein
MGCLQVRIYKMRKYAQKRSDVDFSSGEKFLAHFHPTRLYQFGLLTERKVEGLSEFRDGFLKEYNFYQQNWTNQVLVIPGTDDETDIFEK